MHALQHKMFYLYTLLVSIILTSSYAKVISNNASLLEVRVKELEESNRKLWEEITSSSAYCKLISKTSCGPCVCRDDNRLEKKYYCDCQMLEPQRDCLSFYQLGVRVNGVYKIHQNNLKIIQVYCDQQTDGGGWTVFQRRRDGSTDFYRTWKEYKNGFGDFQNEFWLGNENIFTMTLQGLYPKGSELRIEMADWSDTKKYAKYSLFQIGNDQTKYRLHVSNYSGNAGDSLIRSHNGYTFSTFDYDTDTKKDGSCALESPGGWWFGHCESCNLNGAVYTKPGRPKKSRSGPHWDTFHGQDYSLKFVEMKVRRN